ncbi:hypothetical protein H1S01_00405 [Heliobacterium chlorum]|uniref:Uncharacterized protein n=1 Tax=Heliobacterium chlorum TaxID=2698 RepID=A0ABR7SZW3_HELCL|nr:hypothetical protein [Heliobacterium chlorum]MBC9782966.1 hypothetical protein [Heliobacterium chlorum]
MGTLKEQVYQIIQEQRETTMDQIIVQMFGGSLISAGQMAQLDEAVSKLIDEGKITRTLLGIQIQQ